MGKLWDRVQKAFMPGPPDSMADTARIDARAVTLRPADDLAVSCAKCEQYIPDSGYGNGSGGCALVSGMVRADYVCDLFDPLDAESMGTRIGYLDPDYDGAFQGGIAKGAPVPIAKADTKRQIVFGWANVAKRADGSRPNDTDGDIIEPDDLEDAAYLHTLAFGKADQTHDAEAVGELVESFMVTPDKLEKMGLARDALPQAWWVGYYIADPDVFAKTQPGPNGEPPEYGAFSIGGFGVRERIEEAS